MLCYFLAGYKWCRCLPVPEARSASSQVFWWADWLPFMEACAGVHTVLALLSGNLVESLRCIAGATQPDLKLLHASWEPLAATVALVYVVIRVALTGGAVFVVTTAVFALLPHTTAACKHYRMPCTARQQIWSRVLPWCAHAV